MQKITQGEETAVTGDLTVVWATRGLLNAMYKLTIRSKWEKFVARSLGTEEELVHRAAGSSASAGVWRERRCRASKAQPEHRPGDMLCSSDLMVSAIEATGSPRAVT